MADVIPAPPATPPRFGIIAAAQVLDSTSPDADDDNVDTPRPLWERGFTFAPEQCGSGGRQALLCDDASDPIDLAGNPDVVSGNAFRVWAGDECSTLQVRDFRERARRQLNAILSFEIAEEFWTGDLAQAEGWSQRYLAHPDADVLTTSTGPTSVTSAFAALEFGLGQCARGMRGMIHVTTQVLTHAMGLGLIRVEGTQLVTALDTIVVPDAGYDGSGPDGAPAGESQWAYATGMIVIRRAPIEFVPENLPEAIDRRSNHVTVIAERNVAYVWDECCHLAAEIAVPVPDTGGAS